MTQSCNATCNGALFQVFVSNVTQGTQDAADIVLVVDESGSMRTEHEWLLVMIPSLEEMLVSAGIPTQLKC